MLLIPDDPIIHCMEQTGYPPWWHQPDYPDSMFDEEEEENDDDEWRD